MTSYVALLRAVNLFGRPLLMSDLKAIGEEIGLSSPRTYIASGNLLFKSGKSERALKALLEKRLEAHMGKPVGVMIRTAAELAQVVARNPFAKEPGNRVLAIFLDAAPAADAIETAKKLADEEIALGRREIYVHYPHGQGASRLVIPAAAAGTGRNMNTVAKLADIAKELA